jgi:hypothetical protein
LNCHFESTTFGLVAKQQQQQQQQTFSNSQTFSIQPKERRKKGIIISYGYSKWSMADDDDNNNNDIIMVAGPDE